MTPRHCRGIWRDKRGAFHAIFHGPGHAWSRDGLKWHLAVDTVVPDTAKCHTEGDASGCGGPYRGTLERADGTVQRLSDEERPKVWVNSTSGLPELLFFSTNIGADGMHPTATDGLTRGVTVVQRIRTVKPARAPEEARVVDCEREEGAAVGNTRDAEEAKLCAVVTCAEV